MKSTFTKHFLLGLPLLFLPIAAQSQTLIEGFENSTQFASGGNDITDKGATVLFADEASEKTEGAKSLKMTYNYSGNGYYEVFARKNFDTPINLADAVQFSIDAKGNQLLADNIILQFCLVCSNGNLIQMIQNPSTFATTDRFTRWNFGLSEARWGGYVNNNANSFTASEVVGIQIFLQQRGSVSAPGTAELIMDNFQFYTGSLRQEALVLEDFNYASNTELQSKWLHFSEDPNAASSFALAPNLSGSGQSGNLTITNVSQWQRVGVRHAFDSPINLSNYRTVALTIKGDPTLGTNVGKYLAISLRDVNNSEAYWNSNSIINHDGALRVLLSNDSGQQVGDIYWQRALNEDNWDPAGNTSVTDMTQIASIAIYSSDGAGDGYPRVFTLGIDNITAYSSYGEPTLTEIGNSSVSEWTIY